MILHQGWRTLALLDGFVALTSIIFGAGLVARVVPLPARWLYGTPLSDYTFLGLTMLLIVGGSSLIAAILTFAEHDAGLLLSAIAGLLLAGFEVVEVSLIDPNLERWVIVVVPLQLLYSALAVSIMGLALLLRRRTSHGPQVYGKYVSPK
jgi:hypothetical protein